MASHKWAALGLTVKLTCAITGDLWQPGKVFEEGANEPPALLSSEDNLCVNCTHP